MPSRVPDAQPPDGHSLCLTRRCGPGRSKSPRAHRFSNQLGHAERGGSGSLELDVEYRVELDAVGSDAGLSVNAVEEPDPRHGHRHVHL
jgi:hypothetical protein